MYGVDLEEEQRNFIEDNNLESFNQIEIIESLQGRGKTKVEQKIEKIYGNNGEITQKEIYEFYVKNFTRILTK